MNLGISALEAGSSYFLPCLMLSDLRSLRTTNVSLNLDY